MSLSLAEFPDLGELDGWRRGIPTGLGHAVIVVHTDVAITAEAYVALAGACTHLGCGVDYRPGEALLACPCHGSMFDLAGQVLHGPARLALQVYPVEVDATTSAIRIRVA